MTTDEELLSNSLSGKRGEDQQIIAEVGLSWITTLLRKNHDYGCSVFKVPILAPHLSALSAIDVRMSDKIQRITNLLTTTQEVSIESIDDTFTDLGAYTLLRKVAQIKEKKSQEIKPLPHGMDCERYDT